MAETTLDKTARVAQQHEILMHYMKTCYMALQREARGNVTTAIHTDHIRASMRNCLSVISGLEGREIQDLCEAAASGDNDSINAFLNIKSK